MTYNEMDALEVIVGLNKRIKELEEYNKKLEDSLSELRTRMSQVSDEIARGIMGQFINENFNLDFFQQFQNDFGRTIEDSESQFKQNKDSKFLP